MPMRELARGPRDARNALPWPVWAVFDPNPTGSLLDNLAPKPGMTGSVSFTN